VTIKAEMQTVFAPHLNLQMQRFC